MVLILYLLPIANYLLQQKTPINLYVNEKKKTIDRQYMQNPSNISKTKQKNIQKYATA